MGALLIIGLFVFLGLAVVLVAMRGGPRSAITRGEPTRDSRKVVGFGVAAVIALFGIGLPAFIVIDNEDTQASGGPGGVQLSAALTEGRELFADRCAQCHQLDDAGAVGRVGPDLDNLRPQAALTVNAIVQGRARGQGQMPAELFEGADARKVALYIERVAGR